MRRRRQQQQQQQQESTWYLYGKVQDGKVIEWSGTGMCSNGRQLSDYRYVDGDLRFTMTILNGTHGCISEQCQYHTRTSVNRTDDGLPCGSTLKLSTLITVDQLEDRVCERCMQGMGAERDTAGS